jgi:hypothetical protein
MPEDPSFVTLVFFLLIRRIDGFCMSAVTHSRWLMMLGALPSADSSLGSDSFAGIKSQFQRQSLMHHHVTQGMGVAKDGWYTEVSSMWPGQGMSLKVKEVLYKGKSQFQVGYALHSSCSFHVC